MLANSRPGSDARHHDKRHRASSVQYQRSKMRVEAKAVHVDVMVDSGSGDRTYIHRRAASA